MVLDLIINTLGKPRTEAYAGKTKYDFNCPQCKENNYGTPDNKFNLGILLDGNKNLCHCWVCGYKGNVKYLLKRYGSSTDYKSYCDYNLDNFKSESKAKPYVFFSYPKGYLSFERFVLTNEDHKKAYDYLLNDRGLTEKTIKFFKLGACFEGKYKNRIIIPSFDENNELNFFIGRSFVNEKPTYLHEFVDKTAFICNESNINWNHPITIVEGYFDMISLPINCIPLNGKILLSNLLKKMYKNKAKVIVLLDEGEEKRSKEIKEQLELFNIENVVVNLKNKDLNYILSTVGKSYIKKEVLKYN